MTIRIILISIFFLLSDIAKTQSFQASSVLISEVMFDPTPMVQLSDNEFVELYNNSSDTVSLKNWVWQVGEKSIFLSDKRILPGHCLVLVPKSATVSYDCDILEPEKWLTLANSGQSIILKDPEGKIIHSMTYSPGMYSDALKRAGGWSLELNCREFPFSRKAWSVSWNLAGGSPGSVQFASCSKPDQSAFKAVRTGYFSDHEVLIYFNQLVHPDTEQDDLLIQLDEQLLFWSFFNDRLDCVKAILPQSATEEPIINISISGKTRSCSDEELISGSLNWGVPKQAVLGELVISELMFEPDENGIEFIELCNMSNSVFELNEIIIATSNEFGVVKDFSDNGAYSFLIFPNEYIAISSDKIWMREAYKSIPQGADYERKDLPSLVNTVGGVRLLNVYQELIDEVYYDQDWHYSRLADTKGVSLERLSLTISGMQSGNWLSAAANHEFSTPGSPNSQQTVSGDDELDIQLINQIIKANYDGVEDEAIIRFSLDKSEYVGLLEVRDLNGFLIKTVHPWGLLPQYGQMFWDGIDEQNRKAKDGLYILLFNYRHPDGDSGRWKKAIGLYHY